MTPRRAPAAPPESTEPVLMFAVAKRLGYRERIGWVVALVAVGMIAQLIYLSVWPGVPFLVAAVVLSWVVGYDNKLDRRGLKADRAWRRTPFERVASIVKLDGDMRKWDASAIDLSSGVGFLLMCVLGIAIAVLVFFTLVTLNLDAALIVGVDASVLLLLQWFSGMRSVHRKPDLVLKAKHLRQVVSGKTDEIEQAGTLHAQLLLAEHDAGAAPDDVRMLIDLHDPPGKLLAVQGQVVLNRVQGTPYPYFYCVVIADKGRDLARFAKKSKRDNAGTTYEMKTQDDVDIVVVRQPTSRTSGYHTKKAVSQRLLMTALDIALAFRESAAAKRTSR